MTNEFESVAARDPLAQLLRDTDAAAPQPPIDAGLVDKVRMLARRRRQHRQLVAASCLIAFGTALVLVMVETIRHRPSNVSIVRVPSSDPVTPSPSVAVPVSAVEFARAKAEADARVAFATRAVAAERYGRRLRQLDARAADASPAAVSRVATLRGEAALTLVAQAEQLNRRAGSPADALAAYRRAAELFPDTPWAAVARQKMQTIQSSPRNQEIPL